MPKKILLITPYYYPANKPPSHRIAKFSKYLPQYGWEPVVLCPEFTSRNEPKWYDPTLLNQDTCKTIRVPYNVNPIKFQINRFTRLICKYSSLTFLQFWWPYRLYRAMLKQAEMLVANDKYDMILATTPLPYSLAIASKISQKYQIPWIADFRDIPAEHTANIGRYSLENIFVRMHKKYCKSSSALLSVSQPLVDTISEWKCAPQYVITNGFDMSEYEGEGEGDNDYFTMVYCGSIYASANPGLLLDALDIILEAKAEALEHFRLIIYGLDRWRYNLYFSNRKCSHLIHLREQITHRESIQAQCNATALLFLTYPAVKGIFTTKIFEYLGSGRPILSLPKDGGVIDDLLKETQAGLSGSTSQEVSRILLEWICEWKKTGNVEYKGITEVINKYTRQKQTEKLAGILDKLVAKEL